MKNDYNKNYFWIKKETVNNVKKYYFLIDGVFHEVSREVFNVCYNSYKKQQRDLERDTKFGLISLDYVSDDDIPVTEKISIHRQSELERLYIRDEINRIMDAIDELNDKDKELITNLLIKEKTERELANQLGVSQQTINKRKKTILKKIRQKLSE
ncbi:MAG: sigma-70 family RNA polymerase sigma factor [Longibaculum sp.]